jgi:hypothetical protein
MNKLILLLSALILTACGGGGGGSTPVATPTQAQAVVQSVFSPAAQVVNNFRLARMDYRYDTPSNSKDKNGYQTTSYQSVKILVDQIKQVGFTGIIIQLEAPVNNNTGLINDDPNNIKTPPADLWKVVDYAKSQNLQIWLSLSISDSNTDVGFTPDFTKFTEQKMFESVAAFDKPIAKLAQDHKVDGIFISEGNLSLESDEHIQYWKYLIDQIKTVFTGKLAYTACIIHDTSIFYHVDYAGFFLTAPLSYTPVTDLNTIIKLYNNDVYHVDEVAALKNIYNKYGKKLILGLGAKSADTGVNVEPDNFFTVMTLNTWSTMAQPTVTSNTPIQLLKVQAFFEMIGLELSDITVGVDLHEFSPWLQDTSFSVPSSPVYNYYCCSWEISNNLPEQKVINSYLSKPWGYHTIN